MYYPHPSRSTWVSAGALLGLMSCCDWLRERARENMQTDGWKETRTRTRLVSIQLKEIYEPVSKRSWEPTLSRLASDSVRSRMRVCFSCPRPRSSRRALIYDKKQKKSSEFRLFLALCSALSSVSTSTHCNAPKKICRRYLYGKYAVIYYLKKSSPSRKVAS